MVGYAFTDKSKKMFSFSMNKSGIITTWLIIIYKFLIHNQYAIDLLSRRIFYFHASLVNPNS